MKITVVAPAKVNLDLRIGPPETSGFHGLSTLFCTLGLADTVVVRGGSGPTRSEDGAPLETAFGPPLAAEPDLGASDRNLAVRAARAFAERAGLDASPRLRLVKRIPVGGGLGGGSSDAAAVLRALRRLHPGAMDGDGLMEIAAELGSDVPFFVLGTPLARGQGRGERLTALPALPARPVVVVLPPFGIDTAAAYRWLDEDRAAAGTVPSEPPTGADPAGPDAGTPSWDDVADAAVNDFEDPVFRRHPRLGEVRDRLRRLGARPALLAGSGSTLFGVFGDRGEADAAAESLRGEYPDHTTIVTATRTR